MTTTCVSNREVSAKTQSTWAFLGKCTPVRISAVIWTGAL